MSIAIENISVHEINIVNPIKKQVSLYKEISTKKSEQLPEIKVGRINNNLFVLTNIDVYYGILESTTKHVNVEIIDFVNKAEFVIEFIKQNKNVVGFNPLSLYSVVQYLQTHGMTKTQAIEILQVSHTVEQKILDMELSTDAIEKLGELFSFLSEKLSTFTVPFYIYNIISKCEKNKQCEAAAKILSLIKSRKVTDTKFTMPTYEETEILLKYAKYNKSNENAVISYPNNKVDSPIPKMVHEILKISKNAIIIPGKKGVRPSYFVNKKTNQVSEINEKDLIFSLDDIAIHQPYALTKKVTNHLDLNDGVNVKCIVDKKEILKFLSNKKNTSGILLFKEL
jgi:hypothetical protein